MFAAAAVLLLASAVRGVDVYLHPTPAFAAADVSALSAEGAGTVLAQHLGLEFLDRLSAENAVFGNSFGEKPFVGQGQKDVLLLTMSEDDARDVVPASFMPSFSLATPPVASLDSLVSSFLARASHAYSDIYSAASVAGLAPPRMLDVLSSSATADTLLQELAALVAFLESPRAAPGAGKFGALEITGLRVLADAYGRGSEQYTLAAETVQAALESALAQADTRVALVTFAPAGVSAKRDGQPPPQSPFPLPTAAPAPIVSSKMCFADADACTNATNACSGHGQCVAGARAGRQCFVCACGSTKTEGKTTDWAGTMCERKDVSSSFVLLTGTVITLFLLVGGSIGLLYSVGNVELPGTLTGTSAGVKHN